ncbi:class E sortase [Streptomyces sp. NPDC012617]|uniref:class E sortase n=1 Tax=Streptomyces TaxID=1883 RepID=UPI002274729B|nr:MULTISPECIES: class E sortase [Streptomyces]MCY1652514.1 class E sortase [Streptomyces sp. SL203]MCY1680274.1 class E sortase [Streptomyces sp. SL294]MDF6063538.1 class E sortase [Streptomyces sp. JH010]WSK29398.1 class E sortase [[Kitasatospora] papulosa]
MTSLRPDSGHEGPYAQGAYEPDGTFEAAVEQLADPLNDPLPGQNSSWYRSEAATPPAGEAHQMPQTAAQGPMEPPGEWYDPEGYRRDWYGQQEPTAAPGSATVQGTAVISDPLAGMPLPATAVPEPAPVPAVSGPDPVPSLGEAGPVRNDETVALRTADTRTPSRPDAPGASDPGSEPLPTGGRAERRRAAKGRGRRRAEPRPTPAAGAGTVEPAVPMSRLEARRAARAAKDSPAVVASRVVGEVFITFGVLMLLFVTYQLWWTNVRADQIAGRETNKIQDDWASGERSPGVFEPGKGFAIMHIPKLDVVAPIAEGIDKEKVLDRGMIGHYGEGKLKTAMPSAEQGNFAVAGHRNTHGEPFRYINKLKPGDPIVVETQDAYYTYEMTSILPQTSPSNVAVIDEVPPGSGFTGPGRYITLTTCTPEFTSTYRMIVWGKMVDERPRSKGKPDALVG